MFQAGRASDAGRMSTETHTHTSSCWWNADEAHWDCAPGAGPALQTAAAARTPVGVRRAAVVELT
jgi:hypothetical protein